VRTSAPLSSVTPLASTDSGNRGHTPVGGTMPIDPNDSESVPETEFSQVRFIAPHAGVECTIRCWSPPALHTGAPSAGQTYGLSRDAASGAAGMNARRTRATTPVEDANATRNLMAGLPCRWDPPILTRCQQLVDRFRVTDETRVFPRPGFLLRGTTERREFPHRIASFSPPVFNFTSAFCRSSISTVTSGSTTTFCGSNAHAMVTVFASLGPSVTVLRASA